MTRVQEALREAWSNMTRQRHSFSSSSSVGSLQATSPPNSGQPPHEALSHMSSMIVQQFDVDNRHMATLEGAPDVERLVKVMGKMEQTVHSFQQNTLQIFGRLGAKLNSVQEQMLRLEHQVYSHHGNTAAAAAAAAAAPAPAPAPVAPAASVAATAVASSPFGPAPSLVPSPEVVPQSEVAASSENSSASGRYGSLVKSNPVAPSLAGKEASDMYMVAKANGGTFPCGLNPGDRRRCKIIWQWFEYMATDQERKQLGPTAVGDEPTSAGVCKRIVSNL
jgi:hypothetical protein